MTVTSQPSLTDRLRSDLSAGLVVALVALPLCLGIAHASGAPPVAGLITGIVAGLVVSWLSGSHLSVSGPAAGLIVIVLGLAHAHGYRGLLAITLLAGAFQLLFGVLRAGKLASFFPRPVIEGMLAAIGIILILKQIPHAVGYEGDFEGNLAFAQPDGRNTFTEIPWALGHLHLAAVTITIIGFAVYVLWARLRVLREQRWVPAPLVVVVLGSLLAVLFARSGALPTMPQEHFVTIGEGSLLSHIALPDFSVLSQSSAWLGALTIAIVASIETLLCVEAVDALDPEHRNSPMNRELVAQGLGNMICGAIGGIPMTSVIVRSSANVQAGGRTRLSAFFHGVILLVCVAVGRDMLERIPLSALAAVLLVIGFKLAHPRKLRQAISQPAAYYFPFFVTIGGVVLTDLLTGVLLGGVASLLMLLREAWRNGAEVTTTEPGAEQQVVRVTLGGFVSFVTKATLRDAVMTAPEGALVLVDGRAVRFMDPEVLREVKALEIKARHRSLDMRLQGDIWNDAPQGSEPNAPPPAQAA